MLYLLAGAAAALVLASALIWGARAVSAEIGRRNARSRRIAQVWEAYERTAHDPGEPLST